MMKNSNIRGLELLLIACFLATTACGFVTPQRSSHQNTAASSSLFAKKKKRAADGGQGFGKAPEIPPTPPKSASTNGNYGDGGPMMMEEQRDGPSSFLSSVEGASDAIPTLDPENSTPEERATAILRDQYGMRTREEQQEAYQKQQKAKEERKKLDDWKKLADEGKDFDIMEVLPAPVLIGIDRFLKGGVAICTVLFVLAGAGITVEAWSKASGSPLPENIDKFIVTVVEPNFTPGLGVLLGFSISLGAFAAAQLGSSSATYRQDR